MSLIWFVLIFGGGGEGGVDHENLSQLVGVMVDYTYGLLAQK